MCSFHKRETTENLGRKRQAVAIDCEMVGCGERGRISALARVSIVDETGKVLLNEYVAPDFPVTDYRTFVTGINEHHLRRGLSFDAARMLTKEIIKDKILVGHALSNDLKALMLTHPTSLIRDTSLYKPLRFKERRSYTTVPQQMNQPQSLKKLSSHWLKREIQCGPHDSLEDARATMDLYLLFRDKWDAAYEPLERDMEIDRDDSCTENESETINFPDFRRKHERDTITRKMKKKKKKKRI